MTQNLLYFVTSSSPSLVKINYFTNRHDICIHNFAFSSHFYSIVVYITSLTLTDRKYILSNSKKKKLNKWKMIYHYMNVVHAFILGYKVMYMSSK